MNESAPQYLHNMFNYVTSFTGCVGRNSHQLFVPQINTNYGRRGLYYRGTTIWNSLPTALYDSSSLNQFKCTLVDFLM